MHSHIRSCCCICYCCWACVTILQAADDAQRQLGRTGSNMLGLVFMSPSFIIICVAVYGMLESWWGGIIVILGVNAVLGAVLACWHMATRLEAVRNAAVLSRSVKFVLKLLLAAAAIVLFVFMVNPATVSDSADCGCVDAQLWSSSDVA